MKKYKLCFVGIGSIAERHINNIKCNIENNLEKFEIDALRSSKKPLNKNIKKYIRKEFYSIDDLDNKYDAIFITNPTQKHFETLELLNGYSDNFFIEKPVFDLEDLGKDLDIDYDKTYYVACPIRHSKIISYLKDNLNLDSVNGVICICSSYLPSWHPDKDYRDSYSAKKALGGGVSIDLIHEWDYLKYIFGKPESIYTIIDKVSDLEIDSDDSAVYIAKYNNMLLELHLDYYGRFPIREIMIFTEEDTIIVDIQNSKINYKVSKKEIDFSQERNDYQLDELKYFFDLINYKKTNINDLANAIDVLKLTQGEL